MTTVICPECGEDDRLKGTRKGEAITIHCEACGHEWDRDTRRRCLNCKSENLSYRPQPLFSGGRGTMQTPSGSRDSWDCDDCGQSDCTRKSS